MNKRVFVDLPEDLHKQLKIYCLETDQTMKQFITLLVENELNKTQTKKKGK